MTDAGRPGSLANENDDDDDDDDAASILDDSPITGWAYRLGTVFDLYHQGESTKFRVTEIVERDGRRITYGVPLGNASAAVDSA